MARREESHIEKQKQSIRHAAIMEVALIARATDFIIVKKEFSRQKTK